MWKDGKNPCDSWFFGKEKMLKRCGKKLSVLWGLGFPHLDKVEK